MRTLIASLPAGTDGADTDTGLGLDGRFVAASFPDEGKLSIDFFKRRAGGARREGAVAGSADVGSSYMSVRAHPEQNPLLDIGDQR